MYIYNDASTDKSIVFNCVIVNNCILEGGAGAGVRSEKSGLVRNCLIQYNTNYDSSGILGYGCGGVDISANATLLDCRILDNHAENYIGGVYVAGTMRNCLIQGNSCNDSGGAIYMLPGGSISSCTIVSNSAYRGGAVLSLSALATNSIANCIFYQNTASGGDDYNDFDLQGSTSDTNAFCFCCTQHGTLYNLPPSQGNITNNPKFVNTNAGNYRLQNGSPCANSGTNQTWMIGAKDLDGHRRIDRFSGMVDMGAYERLPKGTLFIIH